MELDYRKVEFSEEIILLLDAYVQNKWPLLLWQSHARSEARKAVVTNFCKVSKMISVSLNSHGMGLNMGKPIYCKGEEKKLIFKSSDLTGQGSDLKIKVPDDVRLYEEREVTRYPMYSNKKAFITVESGGTPFILKLNDISRTGCSVIVGASSIDKLSVGSSIVVKQIGSDFCYGLVSGTFKYLEQMPGGQLYKLGIRFDHQIGFANYYLTKTLEW